jgi:hypothetical protein
MDDKQAMAVVLHLMPSGAAPAQVLASVDGDDVLRLRLESESSTAPEWLKVCVAWLGRAALDEEPPEVVRGSLRAWLGALGLFAANARGVDLRGASAERCWLGAGQLLAAPPRGDAPSELAEICLALLDLVPDGSRAESWTVPRMLRDRAFEVLYGFVRRAWERAPSCPARHQWLAPLAFAMQRQRQHRAPPAVMLNRMFEAVAEEVASEACLSVLPVALLLEALLPEHSRGIARMSAQLATAPELEGLLGPAKRLEVVRVLGRAQELQGDKGGAAAAYELALGGLCARAAWAVGGSAEEQLVAIGHRLPAAVVLIERLAALHPATAEATRADGLAALRDALEPMTASRVVGDPRPRAVVEALITGLQQATGSGAERSRREALGRALSEAFARLPGLSDRVAALPGEPA